MTHKDGWIVVNNVPTRVQTWGGWVEDSLPPGDSLIICFTGNPGVTSFYHTFLTSLYNQLNVPIWITSQAGHELPSQSTKLKCPSDPRLYDMAGQIAHKLAFVKQYVPANRKLYLIGHSLGTKLISELLKDQQIAERTEKCYLMMPTLEMIGDTPNGKFLTSILSYFMTIILFFAWIFSLFPKRSRPFFIRCWFLLNRHHNVDKHCMNAVCHLTLPKVLRNVFNLAIDEMKQIKELDLKVLNDYWPKLKVYFARTDGWAPLSYMERLRKAKPEIDITVLGEHFSHAFVLDNPEEMADIISQQMKKDRLKG